MLHHAAAAFWRVVPSTVLIYMSLLMLTDPAGFLACLRNMSAGLHEFDDRLCGNPWRPPPEWRRSPVSPAAVRATRLAGALLAALAALNLVPLFR